MITCKCVAQAWGGRTWQVAAGSMEGPMSVCCGVDRRCPARHHCTEQQSRGGALSKHRAEPGSRGGPQAGSWWPRLRAVAAWRSSGKPAGAGAQPAGARPSAWRAGAECGAQRHLIGQQDKSADAAPRGAASGAGRPQPAAGGREPGGGATRRAPFCLLPTHYTQQFVPVSVVAIAVNRVLWAGAAQRQLTK